MPIRWPTPTELAAALSVLAAVLVHASSIGIWAVRGLHYRAESPLARCVVVIAIGVVLFEFELWLLGHLSCLNRAAFLCSTVMAGAGLLATRIWRHPDVRRLPVDALHSLRREPVLTGAIAVLAVFVIISGLRGGRFEDDYKWESPKLWAAAGRWVRSPYRISNGMEASEVLYTFPAVFGSLTAAHWAHAAMWALLLTGAAALAEGIGARGIAAAAAAAAVPVISSNAAAANTDVPCAALLTAAFVCVMRGVRDAPDGPIRPRTLVTTGVILAGAVSSKSLMVVGAVSLGLYVVAERYRTTTDRVGRAAAQAFRDGLTVAAPAVLAVALWSVHTYSLIGKPWDTSGQYMARDPTDIMWTTGQAAGRIPSLADVLHLPGVPFYAALLGQNEPYGARIGLLTVTFPILGWVAAMRLPVGQRRIAFWLVGSAAVCYFLLGPFAIKTRFHDFVWIVCAVLGALAYTAYAGAAETRDRRAPVMVGMAFQALVLAGIADSIWRKLLLPG